ncbi:hypothetical protein ACIQU4_26790 [Streptomyces sp. NPDC090741]|uniref:hypothetical protein n=1 Tax=Streptomyces sp. NPDC090741 TaxID=3365967 RepID=UPI0037F41194
MNTDVVGRWAGLTGRSDDTAVIIRQPTCAAPGQPPVQTTVTAPPMNGRARCWIPPRPVEQVTGEGLRILLTT